MEMMQKLPFLAAQLSNAVLASEVARVPGLLTAVQVSAVL